MNEQRYIHPPRIEPFLAQIADLDLFARKPPLDPLDTYLVLRKGDANTAGQVVLVITIKREHEDDPWKLHRATFNTGSTSMSLEVRDKRIDDAIEAYNEASGFAGNPLGDALDRLEA